MIFYRNKSFTPFTATGTGTNAGVTLTKTATTGKQHHLSHVSGSGDAAALVTIESPAGTVVWRKRFTAAFNFSENFTEGFPASHGTDVVLKISASTANCEANMLGFTIG